MTFNRKHFLQNAGSAVAGMAGIGALGRGWFARDRTAGNPPAPLPEAPAVQPSHAHPTSGPAHHRDAGRGILLPAGEDLMVQFFFQFREIRKMTYLDVGANEPIENNNTYYFYRKGYRGVVVEPNVSLCEKLRHSPVQGDTTLAAGIGVTAANEADYYIMTHHSWNTFSKEEADHQSRSHQGPDIGQRGDQDAAPQHQRCDEQALPGRRRLSCPSTRRAWTWRSSRASTPERFRPKIICAETLVSSTTRTRPRDSRVHGEPGLRRPRGFVREHHLRRFEGLEIRRPRRSRSLRRQLKEVPRLVALRIPARRPGWSQPLFQDEWGRLPRFPLLRRRSPSKSGTLRLQDLQSQTARRDKLRGRPHAIPIKTGPGFGGQANSPIVSKKT